MTKPGVDQEDRHKEKANILKRMNTNSKLQAYLLLGLFDLLQRQFSFNDPLFGRVKRFALGCVDSCLLADV